jgi:hypothetical protein
MLQRHAKDYTRVAKAGRDAIRAHDPQRLIVTDGYPGGGSPIPDLFGTGILQSGHTYNPMQVTHHDCEWVRDAVIGSEKLPTWPLNDDKGNIICNRQKLAKDFHPWSGLSTQGAAIHFGEMVADPYDAARLAKQIRAVLDTHGFPKAESILSEWNLSADFMDDEKHTLQGAENAAYIGAVLNYLQDAPIDHAQFSRGDAAWMGLFDLKGQYFKTAYTFKAFAKMLDSVRRLLVTGADIFGFSVIAGRSEDGKSVQVITPFPPATNRIRLECRQNFGRWADRCRIFQQLSVCRREQTLFTAITLATALRPAICRGAMMRSR